MTLSALTLGLFQQIGWPEMLIVLGIGVLLFGRRLPEIGRSIGKGIVEFKRGIKDINDDIEDESRSSGSHSKNRSSGTRSGSDAGWKSAGGDPHDARPEQRENRSSLAPGSDGGPMSEPETISTERQQGG